MRPRTGLVDLPRKWKLECHTMAWSKTIISRQTGGKEGGLSQRQGGEKVTQNDHDLPIRRMDRIYADSPSVSVGVM